MTKRISKKGAAKRSARGRGPESGLVRGAPLAGMAAGVCIVCSGKLRGHPIVDDYLIKAIRYIKRRLNIEQGNRLVVCEGCIVQHRKKRADFERGLLMYSALGLILAVLLLFFNFSLGSLATGMMILLMFIILAHVKYAPKVNV